MRRRRRARAAETESIARAVAKFAVSGLAAVVLLGFVGIKVLSDIGQDEAIREAKEVTAVVGQGIVGPNVTGALIRGDPAEIARLDRIVRARVLNDRVVRVKLWTRDGRVVYSDARGLVGRRYPLDADDLESFDTGRIIAGVSNLDAPENRFERPFGKLLEVYLPIETPPGRRLFMESYQRYSSVTASGRRIWREFLPSIIGVLVLLELVQVPLAWGLARRLQEGQRERERLLRRAVESSDLERRRIARDLHDGAVQNLAGVSYSLAAAAERLNGETADESVATTLAEAATETRRTIRELRTLLVDIYPPDLHREGLESALRDLLEPLVARGIDASVQLPQNVRLPPDVESLFFRCAQEALRNVVSHAEARHVGVRIEVKGERAVLEIDDDGRGFEASASGGARKEGHLGLRLLADLAESAGGRLEISTSPGNGTCVRVEAPLA